MSAVVRYRSLCFCLFSTAQTEHQHSSDGDRTAQNSGYSGTSVPQLLADALGVGPSAVQESSPNSGLDRTSSKSEFPGPEKFWGAFKEDCASRFVCVQTRVRVPRVRCVARKSCPQMLCHISQSRFVGG